MTSYRTGKPGRPFSERPTGPGTAFANFITDELAAQDISNNEIADALGYARPNIVSSWKSARAKFTLDNLMKLSDLLKVDPAYLMALYIDQYVSTNDGVDRLEEIVGIMSRLCTEEEWAVIRTIREARRNNSLPLTEKQRLGLTELFEEPITLPEGPYQPLVVLTPGKDASTRRKFARRGYGRDMSISEIEEFEARKAAATPATEPTVRKRSAAAKKSEPVA
jgi:transcriptional regulator with XRE-family HTH domain